jgi:MYXO-CTERM domain-containing protein
MPWSRLPLALIPLALAWPCSAHAGEVPVASAAELAAAIANAAPGDEIILAPGDYLLTNKLSCTAAGTAAQPIVVRAETLGAATIQFDTVEGFHVQASHWQFERLTIEGVCANDSSCEHAFHVTGDAEFTWIHHNRVFGFNAHIKANGTETGPNGERVWPDDVVVEYNELFNPAPRETSNPVTFIDVVGGRRWIVRGNYIHDFAKAGGNMISYAAFLKGNSRDGLIERNLVVCEQLHTGQVRLGLSLGGGGSSPDSICEDATCTPEHQGGIIRNNIIAHCPSDVGIYVNEGADSQIFNNTLYRTSGIDMRFSATTGEVRNNLLMGQLRNRDQATAVFENNLELASQADFQAWFTDPDALDFSLVDGSAFVDQGENLAAVVDDYCANIRDDGSHDLGALEYDRDGTCDTSVPFEPGPGDGDGDGDGDPTGDGDGDPTGDGDGDGDPSGDGDGDGGDGDGDPSTTDDTGDSDDAGLTVENEGGCNCASSGDPNRPGPAWAWALIGLGVLSGSRLRRARLRRPR